MENTSHVNQSYDAFYLKLFYLLLYPFSLLVLFSQLKHPTQQKQTREVNQSQKTAQTERIGSQGLT